MAKNSEEAAAFHIRPATPDDAPTIAPLVYDAAPEAFDYVLEPPLTTPFLAFITTSIRVTWGRLSHRLFLVAEVDGKVVGAARGRLGASTIRTTLVSVFGAIWLIGPRVVGPIRRGIQVRDLTPEPDVGEYQIGSVSVAAPYRRRGIATALVTAHISRGRGAGARRATLHVADNHPEARRLYERYGFSFVADRPSTLTNGVVIVPDHQTMALDIS